MDINVTGSASTAKPINGTPPGKSVLDKNAFLKILMAQLANQDPLANQDNSQYIAQMAQFSALEQAQNTNASMEKMLASQLITEGSLMIGKNVAFDIGDDNYVQEVVKGLIVDKTKVYLKTANGTYEIDKVIGVGEVNSDK
jgi:flagellar basal-body rod modification protein FlgD